MKRLFRFSILAAFLFICYMGLNGCSTGEKEIKIGAILPLTGDAAQWGIPPQRGAQLAVAQINQSGGIEGKLLKLVIEDTECEPKKGVSSFQKLLSDPDIKIVLGGVCSSVTLAVAPIAENKKILLISPASTNPKISNAGDYIFRVIPSDDLRGKIFAEYLFNIKHVQKVDILFVNNEGGIGNRDAFKNRFSEIGGEIGFEEGYNQNATNLRTELSKIASSNASAIVIVSYPKDTIIILKQIKELKIGKPLYFQTEAIEDPTVLRQTGEAVENVTYILPAKQKGALAEQFINSYKEEYGIEPELFAAEAYDIIKIISQLLATKQEHDIELLKNDLYKITDFNGASGKISFDKNGDVVKPMAIKKILNNKPVLIQVIG